MPYLMNTASMYKTTFFSAVFISGIVFPLVANDASGRGNDEQMWYSRPASVWTEALPLGNGYLGAMVFGSVEQERIQLNESTLYSGDPFHTFKSIDVRKKYGEVVSLLNEGKYKQGEQVVAEEWLGRKNQCYQPMGDVWIDFQHKGAYANYKRSLDLSNAVSTVRYQVNNTHFSREYFISNPDRVMVIRLRADGPEKINCSLHLSSPHQETLRREAGKDLLGLGSKAPGFILNREFKLVETLGDQHKYPEVYTKDGVLKAGATRILYGEKAGNLGMSFEILVAPSYRDGEVTVSGNKIIIEEASEVLLLLSAATSYNGYDRSPASDGIDPREKALSFLNKARDKKYRELYADHVHDYQSLYDKVGIQISERTGQSKLPTDERIKQFANGKDPSLAGLYFQFGRYLMIAGSRQGGQPLNLQGIWNDLLMPPWNSAYTMNINLQMNYWPAEVANLSECHEPLFEAIKELAANGTNTARNMYGNEGWVAHHNMDIWRHAEPIDNCKCSFWPMAAGWLVSHLWEHYLFNGNRDFLKNEVYPLLKGTVQFYKDWLVPTADGFLVTPVGHSPELNFRSGEEETSSFSPGPTMDMAIVRESYSRFFEAFRILEPGEDQVLADTIAAQLARLQPYLIGKHSQLQEWLTDFDEADPAHRHISHLYGIYPGNQIHRNTDPGLSGGVAKVLERRGEGGMGWSKTWKQAIWARLLDGEKAFSHLQSQLSPITENKQGINPGGTFPNLFCGPPFQIDGNFGATAGIAEMLVQSHAGEIHLLPALPAAWSHGKVTGLKARGGFEIDLEWKDKKIVKAVIYSRLGGNCRIRTNEKVSYPREAHVKIASRRNTNPLFSYIDPGSPLKSGDVRPPAFSYGASQCVDLPTSAGRYYVIDGL